MKTSELFAKFTIFGTVKSESTLQGISFQENVTQTITNLCLFRHDLWQISENKSKKKINETIENFNKCLSVFNESQTVNDDHSTTIHTVGLVANSVTYSLSRLVELLEKFNKDKTDWKKESTTATLAECHKMRSTLYEQYSVLKSDDAISVDVEEKLEDLDKTLVTLQKML